MNVHMNGCPLIIAFRSKKTVAISRSNNFDLSIVHVWLGGADFLNPPLFAELAVYNGPDREQLMIAGAKKGR